MVHKQPPANVQSSNDVGPTISEAGECLCRCEFIMQTKVILLFIEDAKESSSAVAMPPPSAASSGIIILSNELVKHGVAPVLAGNESKQEEEAAQVALAAGKIFQKKN